MERNTPESPDALPELLQGSQKVLFHSLTASHTQVSASSSSQCAFCLACPYSSAPVGLLQPPVFTIRFRDYRHDEHQLPRRCLSNGGAEHGSLIMLPKSCLRWELRPRFGIVCAFPAHPHRTFRCEHVSASDQQALLPGLMVTAHVSVEVPPLKYPPST